MTGQALGRIHHVTAITGNAKQNVDFYTQALGMRLVKKTVNQDDVSAYHLFYADASGTPGTDLTFFDWPATPQHSPGIPDIAPVALAVRSPEALQWWANRLTELGIVHTGIDDATRLTFADPEGQRLELVVGAGAEGSSPWDASPVPSQFQVTGLHGVTLASARSQSTVDLLTQVMGVPKSAELQTPAGAVQVFGDASGEAGSEIRVLERDRAAWTRQGRGGVHHVAFRVPDDEAQKEWHARITATGLRPTPVIDRFYFKSVYFREPGGNLFEIATDGPGFTADEAIGSLGEHLALPPFLEPRRTEIEAGLAPIA